MSTAQETVQGIVIDVCTRSFLLISDQGSERMVECETVQEFIDLSRTIYKTNDLRAEIKRKINEETGSKYKEIKLYDQTP